MDNKAFSKIGILIVLIVLIVGGVLVYQYYYIISKEEAETPATGTLKTEEILTLDYLYLKKITNYVNKRILLKTKIAWTYNYCQCEAVGCCKGVDENEIDGDPNVVFENYSQYTTLHERIAYSKPADFFISSDKLDKIKDSSGKEQYWFENILLSNNEKYYILDGKIQYRDWLNITEEILNNQQFIEESNNIIYWSQKFNFELIGIIES